MFIKHTVLNQNGLLKWKTKRYCLWSLWTCILCLNKSILAHLEQLKATFIEEVQRFRCCCSFLCEAHGDSVQWSQTPSSFSRRFWRHNEPSCKDNIFALCQIARPQEISPKNRTIVLIAGNCRWKITIFFFSRATKREQGSQGCFHLRKSFSWEFTSLGLGMAIGQLRASQELGRRLRERPTWDKVTTHYAVLPHFVVLNGLNKCNNKTVSQALKYNYRKILFCRLYVNRSTANGECVPDRDPDTTRHPSLTRFSPADKFSVPFSHTFSFERSHTHTLNHMHLVILFATVGFS